MVYTKVAIILFRTKFLRVFLISHGQNFKVTKSNAQCNMGIIFNTRDAWVESCWLVCAHNNAGINFNTRVVWGVAVVVLVVSLSSAGIIFNTRVAERKSCGGGYAHPLIAWVLFLIPMWQSESRAEIGEHQ